MGVTGTSLNATQRHHHLCPSRRPTHHFCSLYAGSVAFASVQVLPIADGSFIKVSLARQYSLGIAPAFALPVCNRNGADAQTVSRGPVRPHSAYARACAIGKFDFPNGWGGRSGWRDACECHELRSSSRSNACRVCTNNQSVHT